MRVRKNIKIVYNLIIMLICLSFMFISTSAASNEIGYKMDIPSVIAYNRTIQVNINVNTNGNNLAAGVFVITFDSEVINFKDVDFIHKNSNASLEYNEIGNSVKVSFVDIDGVNNASFEKVFQLEFTPKVITESTNISIYFEQAGSLEEKLLNYNNAMTYNIEVSKNTTSDTLANGEEISDKEQEKLENKDEFINNEDETLISDVINDDENSIIINDDTSSENNLIIIFILGFIACSIVFIGVFMMLKYFKEHNKNNNS